MLTFGLLSSVFDFLTFGILMWGLHATPVQFRTGWFLESVISATLVIFVIRSRRPFFASRPSKALALATACIAVVSLVLPFSPLAAVFALTPLAWSFVVVLAGIVVSYLLVTDFTKQRFYRRVKL